MSLGETNLESHFEQFHSCDIVTTPRRPLKLEFDIFWVNLTSFTCVIVGSVIDLSVIRSNPSEECEVTIRQTRKRTASHAS